MNGLDEVTLNSPSRTTSQVRIARPASEVTAMSHHCGPWLVADRFWFQQIFSPIIILGPKYNGYSVRQTQRSTFSSFSSCTRSSYRTLITGTVGSWTTNSAHRLRLATYPLRPFWFPSSPQFSTRNGSTLLLQPNKHISSYERKSHTIVSGLATFGFVPNVGHHHSTRTVSAC